MDQKINFSLDHLIIRGADFEDANKISALISRNVQQFHGEHYTKRQIEIWQDGYAPPIIQKHIEKRPVYILEYGPQICGTIQLDLKRPEIKGFYLDPDFTDKGLGHVLFGFIISTLKMHRCKSVELTSNRWARSFYERQSFVVIGKEIVYWQDEPFEEWRMRRTFSKA